MALTRATLLRRGAVAGLGLATAGASAARAALPKPAPVGDDVGFLQFGVLAERVSEAYYRRAGASFRAAAAAKAKHVAALDAALGADAPAADDFTVALPARAFATRARTVALGIDLEGLLVGTLLNGVTSATDGSTRLLLGRLLASDAQHLAALHRLAGRPMAGGLPVPLDLEAAGARLDGLLTASAYPEQ